MTISPPTARRSGADDRLVLALAAGASVVSAAHEAGVSEATARRRLADPGFRAAVETQRSELLAVATGRLVASMAGAVDVLVELTQPEQGAPSRFRAARAIVELALRARESTDLERRVAELEALVAEGVIHADQG